MLGKDELFERKDWKNIWKKYCGFLDLSLDEFMEVQEELLAQQIESVSGSAFIRRFMPTKPKDSSEFRQIVPLTTYEDYAVFLDVKNEDILPLKPYCWARTSGRGGTPKWVPYTEEALNMLGTYGVSAFILACTNTKDVVNIQSGLRILLNVPPPPYMSGILAQVIAQKLDARVIPPFDKYLDADFETRIQAGFQIALRTGADFLGSLSSVLVKMGERFAESSGHISLNRGMLHPQIMARLIGAWLRSRREHRTPLPKDLWSLKGILGYGMDTGLYKEQLMRYWGKVPLESYGATEIGVIALNAWNKKYMTFLPASSFLEFIPEDEWLKNREDHKYQPSTLLLNEVEPGKRYEVVTTSFYGMPFLRYRVGDIIRIVSLSDEETGVRIPQMVFGSRVDGIIDIAGFTRLDERTIWQAIANTGIKYEDWSARKEYENETPVIRLYIELKEDREVDEVEGLIHRELIALNQDYHDLEGMLNIRPLRVAFLPSGSLRRFYERKKIDGADLAHLKPPHMNASDDIIRILKLTGDKQQ